MPDVEKIHEAPEQRSSRLRAAARVWAVARRRPGRSALALVVALFGMAFYWDELALRGLPRGTLVLGENLSHLEVARARLRVEPLSVARNRRAIACEVDGKVSALVPESAGLRIDVARTLASVVEERRALGPVKRIWVWLKALVNAHGEARLRFDSDRAKLDAELDRVERESLTLPIMGGFRVEGLEVLPEYSRPGRRLARQSAAERVRAAFAEGLARVVLPTEGATFDVSREAVDAVSAHVRRLTASSVVLVTDSSQRLEISRAELLQVLELVPSSLLTAPKVRANSAAIARVLGSRLTELESLALPARFLISGKDQVEIVPSRAAQRLLPDRVSESVLNAAESPERIGRLAFSAGEEPELTTEGAHALSIRGLVSSFSTRHPCCERRVENIHRIADLVDGLLVKPGQIVSLNAVVGPRTKKNGFLPAPTIEEGEMVETLGGGISQFATTLFNALFHGGYDIVERQPHTYWFPRYPMGHEATLSFPKPDLVFRNDTQAGLLIDTVYTKTQITVRLFGDNGGRKIEARVSRRQDIVEPPVEIVGNSSVPPDRERTADAGMIGWSVIVARIVQFPDGTKREERRKVTYRPKVRRVEVHPCRVPRGDPGYTGDPCPEPELEGEVGQKEAGSG